VASRRAAEGLITQGRVRVNGRVVDQLGSRVDPERARIEVDGRRVQAPKDFVYVALNMPSGVVSTASDPQGRRTVLDLVEAAPRLNPVGRLDADTSGLLLLTNHGELHHRLTHPRFQVRKTYEAEVEGVVQGETLQKLRLGVRLDDGFARAVSARERGRAKGRTHLEIVMTEGRKREVRRMLAAVGHPVRRLSRTAFGPISLAHLRSGTWRRLTSQEIGALLDLVGL
jgi:23S rRNA pseudouridine2605 synthase